MTGDDEMMTAGRNLPSGRNVLHRPADGTVSPFALLPMLPYLLDVLTPLIHPVRATTGDVIAVRPGHPVAPVAVVRWDGKEWQLLRYGPPNYGALLIPLLDGVLSERTPGARRVLAA